MTNPQSSQISSLSAARLHRLFPFLALSFGICFLVTTPPLQAPDEMFHLYRAWQVSEGGLVAVFSEKGLPGAYVPKSLCALKRDPAIAALEGHPESRVTFGHALSFFREPLKPQEREFAPLLNGSLYPPVVYVPQAVGIGIGRLFGLPAIALLYLGRFCNLLFWIALVWLTLRVLPFFRWVFFLLALMPLLLFMTATLSTDSSTVGFAFLLTALCLRAAFGEAAFGEEDRAPTGVLAGILVLSWTLALAKQVYAPLALLFFLVPPRKMGSPRRYALFLALLFAGVAVAFVAWSAEIDRVFRPMYEGIDPKAQKAFILTHPVYFLIACLRTYFYIDSVALWFGRLGWYDTRLPDAIVWFHIMLLAFAVYLERPAGIRFARWQRLLVLAVLVLTVALLMTGVYLVWSPVGHPIVRGLRPGRYFVPLAPLVLLLFFDLRIRRQWFFALLPALLALWSWLVLVRRYYDRP